MGLKNKKHGKLLLQISLITGSVMIISVLLTMLMIQQISMNIYFSAKAEMMKADIMTIAGRAADTEQLKWFVGYINEKNRTEGIRRYDVGVDANNFCPVSVNHIIDFFRLTPSMM